MCVAAHGRTVGCIASRTRLAGFLLATLLALPAGSRIGRAAEVADKPPLPAAPAFYTRAVSRIKNIEGDSFEFERDDGKRILIQLACADCSKVHDKTRAHAQTVARNLLQVRPVWIFPLGRPKDSEDRLWANVWTDKGWLAEVLIRAGYAGRRPHLAPADLDPPEPCGPCPKTAPPPAPAFLATECKAVEPGTFDLLQGEKTVRVRLFDITCQGAAAATLDAIQAAASRSIGDRPVWVFPCCPQKPGQNTRCRIWTCRGWIADALLSNGLAVCYADPNKPAAGTASGERPPAPTPNPAVPPRDLTTPEPKSTTWRPIPVTAGNQETFGLTALSAQTSTFTIPSPLWRITWNCKPVRDKSIVILSIYRVDDKWTTRLSSTHILTLKGHFGGQVLRTKPGDYWIKLTCSTDVAGITVEVAK